MSIRVNLLEDLGQETSSPRHVELALAGGAIATSAILAWYLYAGQSSVASGTALQLASLETELEAMRKQNAEVVQLQKDKAELERKIQVVQRLTSPQRRVASVRILDDLSLNTPEFLWLTEFAEKAGSVRINGKAVDNQTVASFAHNLAQSPYFENIEIRETVQEDATSQQAGAPVALTRFLIESHVNYFHGSRVPTVQEKSGQEKSGVR